MWHYHHSLYVDLMSCRKAAAVVHSDDETQKSLELRVAELEQRLIQVGDCFDLTYYIHYGS